MNNVANIQLLQGTEKIKDSYGKINTSLTNLNNDKLEKSGDTMTGKLISAGSSGSIANSEPDKGMIEVRSASDTDAAFMTFHRMGVYASYIGIDVDNKWKVGGWSAGSSAREIWHAGNVPIETGTWTPIITSTSGSNNHTYGSRSGRYVRMGDLVFVWGNVSLTAKDSGMAGTVVIGGLPFLVANDGHYPAVNIGWYGYVAKGNSNQLTARFDPNSPIVSLWEGGDNLGPVALAASKITDTTEFAIGGVYKTNV